MTIEEYRQKMELYIMRTRIEENEDLTITYRSYITNLNNKIKKYDENITYYTSFPKNA